MQVKRRKLAPEEDLTQPVPDYSRDNDPDIMRTQARSDLRYARKSYDPDRVAREDRELMRRERKRRR